MRMNKEVVMVRLSDIIPNRFQPRLTFDEEALNELANSIKEHGIIQPLILRDLGSKLGGTWITSKLVFKEEAIIQ